MLQREDDYETYIQTYDGGKSTRWKRCNPINYMREFRPAKPKLEIPYVFISILLCSTTAMTLLLYLGPDPMTLSFVSIV